MKQTKNPTCIGVIMDGNRRWATEQGKFKFEGHKAGYRKLKEFLRWAKKAHIQYVVAYAFSTENWKRDHTEIEFLLELLHFALTDEVESLKKDKVRVVFIGDKSRFSKELVTLMGNMEKETGKFDQTLAIALSYGGRAEILSAVKKVFATLRKETIEKMQEEDFTNFLWTKDIPDPDMIIRTGGEKRLSNFLPWQSTYSELFFTDTKWPALAEKEFEALVAGFRERKQNGGV